MFGIRGTSTGSGFIYSKGGYVITNAHVVEHANDGRCLVTMWDSTRKRAVVHSMDKQSDIAVIKLTDISYDENLPVATIGKSGEEYLLSPQKFTTIISYLIILIIKACLQI